MVNIKEVLKIAVGSMGRNISQQDIPDTDDIEDIKNINSFGVSADTMKDLENAMKEQEKSESEFEASRKNLYKYPTHRAEQIDIRAKVEVKKEPVRTIQFENKKENKIEVKAEPKKENKVEVNKTNIVKKQDKTPEIGGGFFY